MTKTRIFDIPQMNAEKCPKMHCAHLEESAFLSIKALLYFEEIMPQKSFFGGQRK